MASSSTSASALKFSLETIQRKVDMSLDDIIKQSKRKVMRRNQSKIKNTKKRLLVGRIQETQEGHFYQRKGQPNEGENHRRNVQQRNNILQGIVSARSSAIRQGKLAESRSRNGNVNFIATKMAAQQALSNNVNTLSNRWLRKSIKGTTYPVEDAVENTNISPISQLTDLRIDRKRPAVWRAPLFQKVLTRSAGDSSKPFHKPQTLDSRFATLRRQRKSQFGTHPRWKQGNRQLL